MISHEARFHSIIASSDDNTLCIALILAPPFMDSLHTALSPLLKLFFFGISSIEQVFSYNERKWRQISQLVVRLALQVEVDGIPPKHPYR